MEKTSDSKVDKALFDYQLRKKEQRRLHRIEERREQILSAASSVFAEKGYQRSTTHDIAEEAGVSEGLIYSYFESKDHILLAILEKLAIDANFDEFIIEDTSNDLHKDVLEKAFRIRHGFLDEMDAMMRATMGEAINNAHFREHYFHILVKPALETMENEISEWIKAGKIPNTEPRAASRFLLAELIGLFYLRAINDPYIDQNWQDKEFLQQVSEYYLHGLRVVDY